MTLNRSLRHRQAVTLGVGKKFANALKADQKMRLRTLKDLDAAAMVLVDACAFLLNEQLAADEVRKTVFDAIRKERLEQAMQEVSSLMRPPDDVFYQALQESGSMSAGICQAS